MPKNPLRELLNRLRYDTVFDDSLCQIIYEDFDAPNHMASGWLHLCAVEPKNIRYGDSIIPYHRIKKVVYGKTVLYPLGSDPAAERILKTLGKRRQ